MAISKLSGSQVPVALLPALPEAHVPSSPLRILGFKGDFRPSICSTLVARYPALPCPRPRCPLFVGSPHPPVTPGAIPLHLAPGVPQPHQLHFLTLVQGLEQREKAFSLWALSERGVFCLALRAGVGVGRESCTGACPAWPRSRTLIISPLWNGRVMGQNLRAESAGVRLGHHLAIF